MESSTMPAFTRTAPKTASRFGNQAVLRSQQLAPNRVIAAGLEIGGARDVAETRADAIAAAALRGDRATVAPIDCRPPPALLGLGAGRPLDASVRAGFAVTFGDTLRDVRVHHDRAAAHAANEIGANAFTVGGHVVFGRGAYQPNSLAGRRLLAHELGHATQAEARPIVRCDRGRLDYDYEVARLTTTEIEAELQSVRSRLIPLAATGASTPEYDDLDRRRAALERAMARRDRPRLQHAATIGALRAGGPIAVVTMSPGMLFASSVWSGFTSELATGRVADALRQFLLHQDEFQLGYLIGIPFGLWHGIVNLVEGIGTLAELALSAVIEFTPGIELLRYARDPQAYMARQQARHAQMNALMSSLLAFYREVLRDPTVVIQMTADLGFLLGQEAAHVVGNFAAESPRQQGRALGDIAGQVLFEVLLEILMAATTAGIGNVLRGVEAGAQGVRSSGRLVGAIRRMLEASPALRRLLRALTGVEEGAGAARRLETATQSIETTASVERRVIGREAQGEAGARRLESAAAEVRPTPTMHAEPVHPTQPTHTTAHSAEPTHTTAPTEPIHPTQPHTTAHPSEPAHPTAPGHPVEPTHPTTAQVEGARRGTNFDQVNGLVGGPAPPMPPPPLPAPFAGNYYYRRNPRPPPAYNLHRMSTRGDLVQLTIGPDNTLRYPSRTRPILDVPFDRSLATDLPVSSTTRVTEAEAAPHVAARRQAQEQVRQLEGAGQHEAANAQAALVRRESEALGDAAGTAYMRDHADIAHRGTGANTLDQVWRNRRPPPRITALEAKGGAATNTSSRIGANGLRYQQGTKGYLRSIIEGSLTDSPTARLPRDLALEMQTALDEGALAYIEVSQPIAGDGSLLPAVARRYF